VVSKTQNRLQKLISLVFFFSKAKSKIKSTAIAVLFTVTAVRRAYGQAANGMDR